MMIITSFVPRSRDYRASRAAYDVNEIKRKFKVRFGGALLRLRSGQATTGWEPVLPNSLPLPPHLTILAGSGTTSYGA
jgi:hypothetical protein